MTLCTDPRSHLRTTDFECRRVADASNQRRSPRAISAVAAILLVCLPCWLGCRGRAHDDLYRAKMASQIRVLEDQLYEADYQNRILHDELERERQRNLQLESDAPNAEPSDLPAPPDEPSAEDPFTDDDSSDPDPGMLPEPSNTDLPDKPGDAQPLTDPPPPGLGLPKETDDVPTPIPDASNDDGPLPTPVPPSDSQLMDDSIIPGPVAPPPSDEDNGKIELPKNSKALRFKVPDDETLPIPDHLEIHDGLSGGHRFDEDGEIDGLYLIVTVADEAGNPLSLANYDVDAMLTVVVLEPGNDAESGSQDSEIGRWEFSPTEVRDFVRQAPVDGIHIPVAWKDRVPAGDEVIVHVRMAAAEEEMRCQGRVGLEESVAASHWLPRG